MIGMINHTWSPGTRTGTIQVKARDTENDEGSWGTLSYIVLNDRSANSKAFPILQRVINNFLEKHPRLEALLTQIFERFFPQVEEPEIDDITEQTIEIVPISVKKL